MRLVGLTGGIGAGKSVVSRALREMGAEVVDADQLAREVVMPGTRANAEIAARWPEVISHDGWIDRRALARRVFADPAERAALNAIVHPRVAEASAQRLSDLEMLGVELAIYDAPLIVENKLYEGLDALIVVLAPEEIRVARVAARDHVYAEEVRARMAAQASDEERRARATWIVDNAGPLDDTLRQVRRIWKEICERWPT